MNTPILSDEQIATRNHFVQANAWALAASIDLAVIADNQEKYLECLHENKGCAGISPVGYTKMLNWMKAVAFAILKAGQTLPADHALPTPA